MKEQNEQKAVSQKDITMNSLVAGNNLNICADIATQHCTACRGMQEKQ